MPDDPKPAAPDRRSFSLASLAMAGGLTASYGTLGYVGFQFLKPQRGDRRAWMLVKPVKEFAVGDTMRFRTPAGATVNITRRGEAGTAEDFKALSSVCPHLGCQVHWEAQKNRYFCPCHNGTFDPEGKGTGGPPGDAGQSLGSFELRVEDNLLFIEVPLETLAKLENDAEASEQVERLVDDNTPRGAGHDPCLARRDSSGRPA